jgi:hypothetical protein
MELNPMGKTWKDKSKNRRWNSDYDSSEGHSNKHMKQEAKRFRQERSNKRSVADNNDNENNE